MACFTQIKKIHEIKKNARVQKTGQLLGYSEGMSE